MSKKKAKAAKNTDTATADAASTQGTDPNDPGNNTAATGADGGILSGIGNKLASPFTGWVATIEADTMNAMNQIFNSMWFGLIMLAGLAAVVWGMYELLKDSTPVEGVKSAAVTAATVIK